MLTFEISLQELDKPIRIKLDRLNRFQYIRRPNRFMAPSS
jgi:hypothetical protein